MRKALIPVSQVRVGTSCAVMLEGRGYRGEVICPGTQQNEVHQVRLVDFGTPHSFTELFNLELVIHQPNCSSKSHDFNTNQE